MNENRVFLLGVGVNNFTKKETLEYILKNLLKKGKKIFIVTPNPEILVIAQADKNYKKALNSANLALPDGIGVIWAAKLLGKSLKARITGVDLVVSLCKEIAKRPITAGFLGGRGDVAVKTAECLKKSFPSLKISYAQSEPSEKMRKTPADILFVAFGSPKQEVWIVNNLKKLPVKVAIGVGGSFDFISGAVPRAPKFMRNLGLEWLFRLMIQPWRIKRQLRLIQFVALILKEKLATI
jgi:N-acetylglucosaminyldiphosphoundecaprenol N-acetyl-beta-D-mannosaminyltransferase